jgi:hypothetical protein
MNRRQRKLAEKFYQKQKRELLKNMTHLNVPTEQDVIDYMMKKAGLEPTVEESNVIQPLDLNL